jgi:hypothetical protein
VNGTTALAVGYLGMLVGLGLWTWTVMARNRVLEARLEAAEAAMGIREPEADAVAGTER